MVKWCCAAFQGNYEAAGRRGLSIVAEKSEFRGIQFTIVARAVNDCDRERLPATPVPITLETETGIQFCPWCGCTLREHYLPYVHELKLRDTA